ncbi:MAG: glycoside hydrolase family 3 protein [Clostridia bacterium]|nr:glycoside hydrolase family 3 protein [Clostridia bacterium]
MRVNLRAKPFDLNDEQVAWVEETLAGMSEDDKLRHLFCLVTYDDNEEYCRYLGEEIRPGGFMGRPMKAEQCISAVARMQKYSKIPLLVSANLEAGGNGFAKNGTAFAKPMQIGATADVEQARRLGEICGVEGAAVGANWSFAPIVDIDSNWRNPITNVRTFGSDPVLVEKMGAAYVQEIQKHGVAACIKHFPGDGCDERDQHVAISINTCSCEEWDATYGKVYSAGIEAGTKTVMVGHILQPAYTKHFCPELRDEEMLPASVNKALVTNLLREKLGFNGLIITDSSAMAGLALFLPREKIVPMTIAAGCDMFLFTKNLEEDIEFMRKGYEEGIFDEARLNEAVTRILALKASLGLPEKKANGTLVPSYEEVKPLLGQERFKSWSRECADRAITLVKEEKGIFPLTPARFPRILFCPMDHLGQPTEAFESPSNVNFKFFSLLKDAGFEVSVFEANKGKEGAMTSVDEMKEKYDLILYSVAKRVRYQPVSRIRWADPLGANIPTYNHTIPTVFVSFENPYYLLDVPHMRTYINCYGDSKAVMEALIQKFLGNSSFTGVSPVDPFCGKWETKLSYGPSLHLDEIK